MQQEKLNPAIWRKTAIKNDDGGFPKRMTMIIHNLGGLKKAAEQTGLSTSILSQYSNGKSEPSRQRLLQIARAAKVDLLWFATGDVSAASIFGSRYAPICQIDVEASAGSGAIETTEDGMGTVTFRLDWLKSKGINHLAAFILTARGDSMEPTIRDGDSLLVDVSINKIIDE
jgi:phage repressor protein C with HTH and peptisase S24 domain